jgi:hypothetical protein
MLYVLADTLEIQRDVYYALYTAASPSRSHGRGVAPPSSRGAR